MMSYLTDEQRNVFARDGFLLVSGLIPGEKIAQAQATANHLLSEQERTAYTTTAFNDCYTEALCAVAADLGGEAERKPYYPVNGALVIISPPAGGGWEWPGPHIDHALPRDGHRVFPRPYRLASLLYLFDVGEQGGGTVVWPGSHRTISELAKSDPTRYDLMATVNQELSRMELGKPQEVIARAGDILFYHYLLAHAGSKNITPQARFALNHKW